MTRSSGNRWDVFVGLIAFAAGCGVEPSATTEEAPVAVTEERAAAATTAAVCLNGYAALHREVGTASGGVFILGGNFGQNFSTPFSVTTLQIPQGQVYQANCAQFVFSIFKRNCSCDCTAGATAVTACTSMVCARGAEHNGYYPTDVCPLTWHSGYGTGSGSAAGSDSWSCGAVSINACNAAIGRAYESATVNLAAGTPPGSWCSSVVQYTTNWSSPRCR